MSNSGEEPPEEVRYSLEEALDLLADLEDASKALTTSRYLTVVLAIEHQIDTLALRLALDEDDGGPDDE